MARLGRNLSGLCLLVCWLIVYHKNTYAEFTVKLPANGEQFLIETVPKLEKPVGRKRLQRKSRRICVGKSEELKRKARFFAKQKMRALVWERLNKHKLKREEELWMTGFPARRCPAFFCVMFLVAFLTACGTKDRNSPAPTTEIKISANTLPEAASSGSSPARQERSQSNHIFAAIFGYVKLEKLKRATEDNHFALKTKMYMASLQAAMLAFQKRWENTQSLAFA
jgi:hypothetical protein